MNWWAYVIAFPIAAIASPPVGGGEPVTHAHDDVVDVVVSAAPITVTINPEARVSVARGEIAPSPAICGQAMDWVVRIVNDGFVTAPLLATLVGSVPAGVTLDFSEEPLKGVPEERRVLRMTLTRPGLLDITISFRAKNGNPDLGGRDRVHFLVSCQEVNS
jgi:hypothetical protein